MKKLVLTGGLMHRIKEKEKFVEKISVRNAVVEQIYLEPDAAYVTIRYGDCSRCRQQRVTLVVNHTTVILDETGREIPVRELEEGMLVDAVFSKIMTKSIPPQSQAFQIQVQSRPRRFDTTVGRIVEVNEKEHFIMTASTPNPASAIRFHITPETKILDPLGRKIPLSRLVPGLRVSVEHADFMTASLPPQTTAFEVRVIR